MGRTAWDEVRGERSSRKQSVWALSSCCQRSHCPPSYTINTHCSTMFMYTHEYKSEISRKLTSYQHRSAIPNMAWLLNKKAIPLASPSDDREAATFRLLVLLLLILCAWVYDDSAVMPTLFIVVPCYMHNIMMRQRGQRAARSFILFRLPVDYLLRTWWVTW